MYGGELILNRFCICVVCMRERVKELWVCESVCFGKPFVCVRVSKEMHHDNSE